LAFLTSLGEDKVNTTENLPLTFTFKAPIPSEVLTQNQVPKEYSIEAVYLSGTFNNWNDHDSLYKMSLEKDQNWHLQVTMAPSQIQYKFVVYLKGLSTPVWTHDISQSNKIEDGFGGFNSVFTSNDTTWWFTPLYFILLGASVLSLLMGLMELVSFLIFRYGLSERVRSLVLIWIASVFALGFALMMNMDNQRALARSTLVESLNLFHLFLTGEGFDAQTQKSTQEKDDIFQRGRTWFFKADARNNPRIFNNQQTTLRALFLFDLDFKLISHLERQQESGRTAYWVSKTGTRSAHLYYQNYLLKNIIAEAKTRSVPPTGLYGKENEPMLSGLPQEARWATWILGFNTVLLPIYQNQELQGYYGAIIHPEIYSDAIYQLLVMNLFWLLAITITAFLYYFILPKSQDDIHEQLNRFSSRYQLSTREKEVLNHLITGLSNLEIGEKLFISEGTVKVHVYKIYQKSGVSSRMELMDHLTHI